MNTAIKYSKFSKGVKFVDSTIWASYQYKDVTVVEYDQRVEFYQGRRLLDSLVVLVPYQLVALEELPC